MIIKRDYIVSLERNIYMFPRVTIKLGNVSKGTIKPGNVSLSNISKIVWLANKWSQEDTLYKQPKRKNNKYLFLLLETCKYKHVDIKEHNDIYGSLILQPNF